MIPGRIPGRERWEVEDKLIVSNATDKTGELKIYGGKAGEKALEIFYGSYSVFSILATGSTVILLGGSVKPIQIGDAGATTHTLDTNDDLVVTGRMEVHGTAFVDELLYFAEGYIEKGSAGSTLRTRTSPEEIKIAIGASTGVGVVTLAAANSELVAVMVRVTQAPGGGPTHFDVGRTAGGNLDEYIDNQVVTLAGKFNIAAHGDGSIAGSHYQAAADTITVTVTDGAGTPVNVTGADMKVRVVIFRRVLAEPTS